MLQWLVLLKQAEFLHYFKTKRFWLMKIRLLEIVYGFCSGRVITAGLKQIFVYY